jgi:hypothetical protein
MKTKFYYVQAPKTHGLTTEAKKENRDMTGLPKNLNAIHS